MQSILVLLAGLPMLLGGIGLIVAGALARRQNPGSGMALIVAGGVLAAIPITILVYAIVALATWRSY